jgi:hypothetical protein
MLRMNHSADLHGNNVLLSQVMREQVLSKMGIYRHIANSLFMKWRQRQRRPEHLITAGFQNLNAEEHRSKVLRLVLAERPSLKTLL